MSRGLGRVQRELLDGLVKLSRDYEAVAWPLNAIMGEAWRDRPAPEAGKRRHKLQRRPEGCGDGDNPSRAMAGLIRRSLVRREGRDFALTDAAAALAMPRTVWAGRVTREGVEWREAEVVRVTVARATLRLDGIAATVSMKALFSDGARSSRHPGYTFSGDRGLADIVLNIVWKVRYGASARSRAGMRPIEAADILRLPQGEHHTPDAIQGAFRQAAKETHPDVGGKAEAFREAMMARDVLLSVWNDQ